MLRIPVSCRSLANPWQAACRSLESRLQIFCRSFADRYQIPCRSLADRLQVPCRSPADPQWVPSRSLSDPLQAPRRRFSRGRGFKIGGGSNLGSEAESYLPLYAHPKRHFYIMGYIINRHIPNSDNFLETGCSAGFLSSRCFLVFVLSHLGKPLWFP